MKKLTKTIIVAALAASQIASAATFNNGAGDNLWETPGNWVGGVLPTSSDGVDISSNVTLSSSATTANTLIRSFEFTLDSGAVYTTGNSNVGQANSNGIVTINTGASYTINTTASMNLAVGNTVNGSGTLNLNGGTISLGGSLQGVGGSGATRAESFVNFNAGTGSFRNFSFSDADLTNVVFNWALSGTSTVANISVTSASFVNNLAKVDTFNFGANTLVNGDVVTLVSGVAGTTYSNLAGIAVTGIASGGVISQVGNDLVLTVIPEPSSLMLLTGGLLSLAFYRRRKA